jgi:hypothetical protein
MNKRQAAAELRKLGYAKSHMQMTRGATSYTLGGRAPSQGLMITLSEGGFIISDTRPGVPKEARWTFVSMALNIENLHEGAKARFKEIMNRLLKLGVISPDGREVRNGVLSLAVAIATGERVEAGGAFNGV